ncbi:MAG: thymidine phosphorylase [Atribacterota bacterium]
MNIIGIIEKKKNNKALSTEEIQFIIDNYLNGKIRDYQMSSLLMAIWFNGMTEREINDLTITMAKSGQTLDLSSISGEKVDKHSTGGVGDKTSLALLPMVAAAGVPIPKISGRGLGHTGGTIDKLESINGFKTNLSIRRFIEIVKDVNASIISANINIAPADKKIYSLRDVTGTIDSIPLIASSIMSKKIAGGADAFVLNITVGKGAFIKNINDAILLGKTMVNIGENNNKATYAILSSMNQPLGYTIGNSLEIEEAIALLNNQGPDDLRELCLCIGSYMLKAAKVISNPKDGVNILKEVLRNGKALAKFRQMVKSQNGDIRQIDSTDLLPKAKYKKNIYSERNGFIDVVDARMIGEASMALGAGREVKDAKVDLSVGIILKKKKGDYVSLKEALATLYFNDEKRYFNAKNIAKNAFHIIDKKPEEEPFLLAVIDKCGLKKLN